jgi:cephalosporin hydroxylase
MSFQNEINERVKSMGANRDLKRYAADFMKASVPEKYSYNFNWLGRPIIQYPQDMVAMQELIWDVKPDYIVETGIAHGGSLIFYASILELISICTGHEGSILGIDIDIRPHNRLAIEEHPMYKRIEMIQGSSIDEAVISAVKEKAKNKKRVMVCLDSNHTHDHALAELNAYSPLTSIGSYCIVFDTLIEDMGVNAYPDREWGVGNNPKTAVLEFLKKNPGFIINESIDDKLLISVAPSGYLKRIG